MTWGRIQILALCLYLASTVATAQPQITITELPDQQVFKGDTVVIDCAVQNVDRENFLLFLYHDGSAIVVNMMLAVPNSNYELDTSVSGHWKLTIQQAKVEDQGNWECRVQIPQEVSQEMFLEVLAAPAIEAITMDKWPIPGSTITLWCNTTGSPEPAVTWTRQRPLDMLPSGVQYVTGNPLVIDRITGLWRGLYQCHAANGVGPGPVNRAVFLQMEYSPVVEADNNFVSVPTGEQANLECIGQAYPPVTMVDKVKWRRNGRLVDPNNGYQMSVRLDTKKDPYMETSIATLIVNSVGRDTVGDYSCLFENKRGASESTIRLEIGKTVNPDTGKSTSGSSTITAAIATNMAVIAIATMLTHL